jgi:hypothetical protein
MNGLNNFPQSRPVIALIVLAFIIQTSGLRSVNAQSIIRLMASQPEKLVTNLNNEIVTNGNIAVEIGDGLVLTGGTPPFSYVWMQGNNILSTNSVIEVESGLATLYQLIITDSRGCTSLSPVTVGIDHFFDETIKIYPIPARTYITIDPGVFSGKITLALLNYSGERLWAGEISGKYNLQLNYPSGVYFLEMRINNQVTVKKILITGSSF